MINNDNACKETITDAEDTDALERAIEKRKGYRSFLGVMTIVIKLSKRKLADYILSY